MKKTALRIPLLLACLLAGPACAPARTAADTLALTRVERSTEKRIKEYHALTFHAQMDLPTAAPALRRSVEAWTDSLFTTALGIGRSRDEATAEERAGRYEQEYIDGEREEILRIAKQRRKEAGTFRLTYACDLTMRRVHETAQFITYIAETSTYKGEGASTQGRCYATFRKADGHILGWSDLVTAKKMPQLRGLVADALRGFFGAPSYAALCERLSLGTTPRTRFPLPAGGPGLLADGLYVQYADGELAPLAGTSPLAIVPYARMAALWSPAARKLRK